MPKARILLVEDDINLGFVIKDNLEINAFEVVLCDDGEKGWQSYQQSEFDICVLDVMLPKKDGFSLAQSIRQQNEQVPIIFLTAKSMKEDKIAGFRIGADDYMTKPFSIEELILRIEVFLKRSKPVLTSPQIFTLGAYTFEPTNLLLTLGDQKQYLTQKEADILKLFCQNRDQTLRREEILKQIWGDDDYFIGRSLDVFISKLRKYLKDDDRIELLNLHGIGFRLVVKNS
jgi:DNA-binding response OmpR family regulator